nr:hypothetical protein [uncultured Butyrivibrio sp.]
MSYKEEMEIDLIDLLHVVLCKWRSIVVFMLLGAVVMGAVSYFMPAAVDKSKAVKVTVITRNELNELRDKLDDKKAEEVLLTVDSYLINKEKYEELLEQQDNSIRYKIDAEKEPNMKVTYMISDYIEDTHAYMSEVTSADNIISLYRSSLQSASVIQQIRDVTGYDVNEVYIKELYSVSKAGLSMMDIYVNAPSKEECEAIMGVLEKNVNELKASIAAINAHKIQKVDENYYEQLDSGLRDTQKSVEQSLIDYQKSFLTVPTTFSADQKTYYETLIDINEGRLKLGSEAAKEAAIKKAEEEMMLAAKQTQTEDTADEVNFADVVSSQKSVQKVLTKHVSKKYVALGALAGAFLVILWYCAAYVLAGVLRTEADLSDIFRLSIYGRIKAVNGNGKKKLFSGVDKWVDGLFYKNRPEFSEKESLDIVCSGIGVSAQKNDAKKIFVTGVGNDADSEKYKAMIVSDLKSGKYLPDGCEVDFGKNVVFDPRALEKMAHSDGVVLVEKIGSSRYENIGNELEAIQKYGVNVFGAVVLE